MRVECEMIYLYFEAPSILRTKCYKKKKNRTYMQCARDGACACAKKVTKYM